MIKKLGSFLFAGALLTGLAACTSGGSTPVDQTSAAASSEASNAGAGLDLIFTNQPAPVFATSAYRQQLIEIEAVEALGSPTTLMFFPPGWNGGSSHPFKTCPGEGLPIPNTTQLDNPDEIVQDPYGGGYNLNNGGIAKPQADPNGVYTPTSSSGTYGTCISSTGGLEASYWEGDMYAQTGTAIWNTTLAEVQDVGPDQLPICVNRIAKKGDGSGIPSGTSYTNCTKAPCPPAGKTIACLASLDTPTAIPEARHGHIVMERYTSINPLILNCSMHEGTIWQNGRARKHQGLVSTCDYPGGLELTFAPWGIVSAG